MRDDDEHADSTIRCQGCGTVTAAYDVVSYGSMEGGYRQLCSRCFNTEVASTQGLELFENIQFDELVMTDCAGEAHTFHFRTRLLGIIETTKDLGRSLVVRTTTATRPRAKRDPSLRGAWREIRALPCLCY